MLYKRINTVAGPQILQSIWWRSHLLAINSRREGGKRKRNKLGNWVPLCVWWSGSLTENKLFVCTVCHACELCREWLWDSWRWVRRCTWCLWNLACPAQLPWVFIMESISTLPKAQDAQQQDFQGAQWGLFQVLAQRSIRSSWSIDISRLYGSKNLKLGGSVHVLFDITAVMSTMQRWQNIYMWALNIWLWHLSHISVFLLQYFILKNVVHIRMLSMLPQMPAGRFQFGFKGFQSTRGWIKYESVSYRYSWLL